MGNASGSVVLCSRTSSFGIEYGQMASSRGNGTVHDACGQCRRVIRARVSSRSGTTDSRRSTSTTEESGPSEHPLNPSNGKLIPGELLAGAHRACCILVARFRLRPDARCYQGRRTRRDICRCCSFPARYAQDASAIIARLHQGRRIQWHLPWTGKRHCRVCSRRCARLISLRGRPAEPTPSPFPPCRSLQRPLSSHAMSS